MFPSIAIVTCVMEVEIQMLISPLFREEIEGEGLKEHIDIHWFDQPNTYAVGD